eukprot:TRINITY_DN79996_c0_g1_i1.p2 TRINITY_DN79996_c0_g1~~TRINITY_DN79996_c0_g1_i1.p2  ORF type:complete len:124 (+),score=4.47 TRINITY_DN79996_c0_g1_i1:180-551(+)
MRCARQNDLLLLACLWIPPCWGIYDDKLHGLLPLASLPVVLITVRSRWVGLQLTVRDLLPANDLLSYADSSDKSEHAGFHSTAYQLIKYMLQCETIPTGTSIFWPCIEHDLRFVPCAVKQVTG